MSEVALKYVGWRKSDGAEIEKTSVPSPLFILGHWRSGTTYLHQLLASDERFAFPSLYQISNPHIFLSTESASTRLTRFFLSRQRAFDNVRQTWQMPNEDEIATTTLTLRSQYLSLRKATRTAGCRLRRTSTNYSQRRQRTSVPAEDSVNR